MVLNPHVQKRAQEEIDAVIGSGRLPNLNDRAQGSLPYVEAIINEVLRWHNATPFSELLLLSFSSSHLFTFISFLFSLLISWSLLSISGPPHVLAEEQVLEGYSFPKGTVLIGNIWEIMHDEMYFSRPFEFLPERFLKGQSRSPSDSLSESDRHSHPDALLNPWNYVFGFGRRSVYALSYFPPRIFDGFSVSILLPSFTSHSSSCTPSIHHISNTSCASLQGMIE
jgi:hypothetical protein